MACVALSLGNGVRERYQAGFGESEMPEGFGAFADGESGGSGETEARETLIAFDALTELLADSVTAYQQNHTHTCSHQ